MLLLALARPRSFEEFFFSRNSNPQYGYRKTPANKGLVSQGQQACPALQGEGCQNLPLRWRWTYSSWYGSIEP